MLPVLKCMLFMGVVLAAANAQADIFSPESPSDTELRKLVEKDRDGGYLRLPAGDDKFDEVKVSDSKGGVAGPLAADEKLSDLGSGFIQEVTSELRPLLSRGVLDKVPANTYDLLRLNYSSPALADIVKHARIMVQQRMLIDEMRLTRVEAVTDSLPARLRRTSLRLCLSREAEAGLSQAMDRCYKDAEPFRYLPTFTAGVDLTDGRRNVHVVRDAVGLLALERKSAGEDTAALAGDVVISANDIRELFPKRRYWTAAAAARGRFLSQWTAVLKDAAAGTLVSDSRLADLSLPGVPLTRGVLADLLTLPVEIRGIQVRVLSSWLGRTQARAEFEQAADRLEYTLRLPQLPEPYRDIIREKKAALLRDIERDNREEVNVQGYRQLLSTMADSAAAVRVGFWRDAARDGSAASAGETDGGAKDVIGTDGLMINY